jgi:osomolarity two-component system phosphorelay intermediate protein YPD1
MDPNLFDNETFNQLLSLDEDETNHEFSKNLVIEFFSQANKTIDEMEVALYSTRFKEINEN